VVGAEVAAPPPIVIKDKQLTVLAAHVATTTRRLANAQWWGAGNSGKSRGSVRADINQPKSGSKDVQNVTWFKN
jgi:hypothetical protein